MVLSPLYKRRIMSEETLEKPKLKGIALYHEQKRLEKQKEKGLKKAEQLVAEQDELDEIDFGINPNKTYVFEVLEKSESFRTEILSTECKIFDGERIREIKYIPIADTIFVDEMGGKYDGYSDSPLCFHRNQIVAEGTDRRKVEFLLTHDLYDGNQYRLSKRPPLYTLVNKEDIEQRKEKRFNLELKAMNAVNDSDIGELLPIARVVFNIMETDTTAVKNKLREYSKTNPQKVLDNFDSPRIKRAYAIQKAFDDGTIYLNKETNSVVWGSTKAFITEVKATKDADALTREITDFTFTDEGQKVYDVLKKIKS